MGHFLAAGVKISHYRVLGPLGAGGRGEVCLVASQERLRRFVLEAKTASSLSHERRLIIRWLDDSEDVVLLHEAP
jgi:hypothetical protein